MAVGGDGLVAEGQGAVAFFLGVIPQAFALGALVRVGRRWLFLHLAGRVLSTDRSLAVAQMVRSFRVDRHECHHGLSCLPSVQDW